MYQLPWPTYPAHCTLADGFIFGACCSSPHPNLVCSALCIYIWLAFDGSISIISIISIGIILTIILTMFHKGHLHTPRGRSQKAALECVLPVGGWLHGRSTLAPSIASAHVMSCASYSIWFWHYIMCIVH
jgi:hypothetical protein